MSSSQIALFSGRNNKPQFELALIEDYFAEDRTNSTEARCHDFSLPFFVQEPLHYTLNLQRNRQVSSIEDRINNLVQTKKIAVSSAEIEEALKIGLELQKQGIRGKVLADSDKGLCRNLFILDDLVIVHLNKLRQGDQIVGKSFWEKKIKFGAGSDGKLYAISSWLQDSKDNADFENEITIMEKLSGVPYILQLVSRFTGKSKKHPEKMKTYMITPYCENDDLWKALDSGRVFSGLEKIEIALSILKGLKSMHDNGILHRDIKLENILLPCSPPFDAVVADFNLSMEKSDWERTKRQRGTNGYLSPELLRPGTDGSFPYSKASDVYAAGVTLYSLENRCPVPYYSQVLENTKWKLEKINGDWLTSKNHGTFLGIVSQMVRYKPENRLSVESAIEQFEVIREKILSGTKEVYVFNNSRSEFCNLM